MATTKPTMRVRVQSFTRESGSTTLNCVRLVDNGEGDLAPQPGMPISFTIAHPEGVTPEVQAYETGTDWDMVLQPVAAAKA